MLWGHRNDPVNFHRCLQDFDRRLPDLLEALRPGDLLIVTSDHGCDPTTPSTDHSREHALLLAYAPGQERRTGGRHEGEFADVGATVNAWLGGKAPGQALARPADRRECERAQRPGARPRASTPTSPASPPGSPRSRRRPAPIRVRSPSRRSPRREPQRVLEVGCGRGELAERMQRELDARVVAVDQSERMVELTAARGVEAIVGDVQDLPFRDGIFDCAVAAWMLYHVPDLEPRAARAAARARPGRPARRRDEQRAQPPRALGARRRDRRAVGRLQRRERRGALLRHFTIVERRDVRGTVTFPDREAAHRYVSARPDARRSSPTACRSSTARSSAPATSSSSSASRDPPGRADPAQARRRGARRRRAPRARARLHRAARSPTTRWPRS